MISIQFIIIGVLMIFIYVNIFWTQKIYYRNKFAVNLLLSVIIPIIAFLVVKAPNKLDGINFGLILFHYTWLLFLIKLKYKDINSYLIKKGSVDTKFADKGFTSVNWDGDLPGSGDWRDEKRSTQPSWFDHLLTVLLFVLPISLTIPITIITQNGS